MCLVIAAQAQKLYPLHGNAAIIQYNKTMKSAKSVAINGRNPRGTTDSLITPIYLPFYDEFSYTGPYPDASKWLDQYVFINHTKAINPPTLGVATFDGLNQYGFPYDSTVSSAGGAPTPPEKSDTLTSYPIRLDSLAPSFHQSLSAADSVYLSFYYQAMGFWEEPATNGYEFDLDLYSPLDSTWYNSVWSVPGYYPQDSLWHQVMIPIDSIYFGKGFQFRFRNLSCGCGDDDHWHIDEVYLNSGRINTDTIIPDVSFVYDLHSPLKNYTQMPYTQYVGASDMRTTIGAFLRSNEYDTLNFVTTHDDSTAVSISTFYNIFDHTGTPITSVQPPFANGSNNLWSFYNTGYCHDPNLIAPPLGSFVYPSPLTFNDSFTVKFFVSTPAIHAGQGSSISYPQNDTAVFHQVFSNYFAYDDGSAEGAFGIESVNCPGNYKIAALYVLNKPDTLRAIDIFFDPIIDVGTIAISSTFNLMVWSNNGGVPGNLIYTDTTYNDSTTRSVYFAPDNKVPGVQRINMFNRYQLLHGVPLAAADTFFIGINQIQNYPAIPIGFDMNTDFHNNFFYTGFDLYCNPTWYVFPGDEDPSYRGSLMMRAVIGDSLEALGIRKYNNTISANITIYPNPATDQIFIQSDNTITKVVVTDLIGNLVIEQTANPVQRINTASLQDGVYLIKAFTDKGLTDTKKLIISR
jgi:hypothetical protein